MLKAYIIAYCQNNLGDDMFVRSLVRRYPQIQFSCDVSPDSKMAFRFEDNLKTPSRFCYFVKRVLNRLRLVPIDSQRKIAAHFHNLVIRIGGSIFIENPHGKKKMSHYFRNQFVIGANFGPYYSDDFLQNTIKELAGCLDVCFRDRYSFYIFQELAHVRYAPDILFGYKYYPIPKRGKGVGISVIAAHERNELVSVGQRYYEIIAHACDMFARNGIPVRLFSFCNKEGDMIAVNQILNKVSNIDAVEVVDYEGDIDVFLDKLNDCEYIIATRFHAMILGWAMEKKVLPIIYSKKQSHVIQDLAYQGFVWNLLEGQLPEAAEVVEHCLTAKNSLNVADLARESERQFMMLDLFLQEKM